MPQTGFTTAPAGISPWLIYLERAMSSLRASATIEMRRIRPRSEPTCWRNQQLRALSGWYLTHIQASSTIVVRRRGLPALEIPCSWSMLHSSMDWEPGRHMPPTAVGSQSGGTVTRVAAIGDTTLDLHAGANAG